MGDDRFPERFAEARRHGVYLRILADGALQAGDQIQVVERPAHGFRAVEVAHIFYDQHHRAGELLGVADPPSPGIAGLARPSPLAVSGVR